MSDKQLETKVIGKVNLPFKVVRKRIRIGFFKDTFIISCYNSNVVGIFRLKISESMYNTLEVGEKYFLKNQSVFQRYDGEGYPVEDQFVKPSNMLLG